MERPSDTTSWTDEELRGIAAPPRSSRSRRSAATATLRTPTIDLGRPRGRRRLYVRAAYGPSTGWHRVARRERHGPHHAPAASTQGRDDRGRRPDADNDAVDAAYRAKYGHYASIVDGITDAAARSSTLRLVPRA